ncbi:LysR family transcriptional regulator [Bosea sp. TWI1241]|jgi:DNA-binding transcriptional LysR family regulator|uniref:LysR family transcriptional regulator n=1 Tax=Bosea sp. TWI1241 TaxID=3148904 RepID=UPI00320A1B76
MNFRPDLTTLRMFLAVYRQGNMTKAAEREHIAPSAISKRIQDLEFEIGTPLFYRHARGMTATPAGEVLARHTAGLFDDVNRMAAELSGFNSGEEGQARLHAHQSAVVQHLPRELAAFRDLYPRIRVVLREETTPNVIQSMYDGLGDIGIFAEPTHMPEGLQIFEYKSDALVALLPVTHALAGRDSLTLQDIEGYDFISLETGSSLQVLVADSAAGAGIALSNRIEVVTFTAAVQMVECGFGLTIVPAGIARIYCSNPHVTSVPFSEPWALRRLMICTRDEPKLTASARLLLNHLRGPSPVALPFRPAKGALPNR